MASSLFILSLAASVVIAYPTVITPECGNPITVTAQHQAVSTCSASTACIKGQCSTITPYTTYTYVSTVIPCAVEGPSASTTTVTCIDQPITVSKHTSTETNIVKPTQTSYTTYIKEWVAPYKAIGEIAIGPYDGSGLCKACEANDMGIKTQFLNVTECITWDQEKICLGYPEVWVQQPIKPIEEKVTVTCQSTVTVPAPGTYTYTFMETAPPKTITIEAHTETITLRDGGYHFKAIPATTTIHPAQPYYAVVTKECAGPTTIFIDATITKKISYSYAVQTGRSDDWIPNQGGWDDWYAHAPAPAPVGWNDWKPAPPPAGWANWYASSSLIPYTTTSSDQVITLTSTAGPTLSTSSGIVVTVSPTVMPSLSTSSGVTVTLSTSTSTATIVGSPFRIFAQDMALGSRFAKRAVIGYVNFINSNAVIDPEFNNADLFTIDSNRVMLSENLQVGSDSFTANLPMQQFTTDPNGPRLWNRGAAGRLTVDGSTGFCFLNNVVQILVNQSPPAGCVPIDLIVGPAPSTTSSTASSTSPVITFTTTNSAGSTFTTTSGFSASTSAVVITTTNSAGSTFTTTSGLQAPSSSVVTFTTTNSAGSTFTSVTTVPIASASTLVQTTTNSAGSTFTTTNTVSAASMTTAVITTTDAAGSTSVFTTTASAGGSSLTTAVITTTDGSGNTITTTSTGLVGPSSSSRMVTDVITTTDGSGNTFTTTTTRPLTNTIATTTNSAGSTFTTTMTGGQSASSTVTTLVATTTNSAGSTFTTTSTGIVSNSVTSTSTSATTTSAVPFCFNGQNVAPLFTIEVNAANLININGVVAGQDGTSLRVGLGSPAASQFTFNQACNIVNVNTGDIVIPGPGGATIRSPVDVATNALTPAVCSIDATQNLLCNGGNQFSVPLIPGSNPLLNLDSTTIDGVTGSVISVKARIGGTVASTTLSSTASITTSSIPSCFTNGIAPVFTVAADVNNPLGVQTGRLVSQGTALDIDLSGLPASQFTFDTLCRLVDVATRNVAAITGPGLQLVDPATNPTVSAVCRLVSGILQCSDQSGSTLDFVASTLLGSLLPLNLGVNLPGTSVVLRAVDSTATSTSSSMTSTMTTTTSTAAPTCFVNGVAPVFTVSADVNSGLLLQTGQVVSTGATLGLDLLGTSGTSFTFDTLCRLVDTVSRNVAVTTANGLQLVDPLTNPTTAAVCQLVSGVLQCTDPVGSPLNFVLPSLLGTVLPLNLGVNAAGTSVTLRASNTTPSGSTTTSSSTMAMASTTSSAIITSSTTSSTISSTTTTSATTTSAVPTCFVNGAAPIFSLNAASSVANINGLAAGQVDTTGVQTLVLDAQNPINTRFTFNRDCNLVSVLNGNIAVPGFAAGVQFVPPAGLLGRTPTECTIDSNNLLQCNGLVFSVPALSILGAPLVSLNSNIIPTGTAINLVATI